MKKKFVKKLISGLLALLMVFSILPETAHAMTWEERYDAIEQMSEEEFLASLKTITYPVTFNQTEARKMLPMVNEFRTSGSWIWNGDEKETVPPQHALKWDYGLEKAAMIRAAEAAFLYDHTRPNFFNYKCDGGKTENPIVFKGCEEVFKHLNLSLDDYLCHIQYAENLSMQHKDSKEAFIGWKEENCPFEKQGHRRQMLHDFWNYVAVGCAISADGTPFWVMLFEEEPVDQTEFPADDSTINFTTNVAGLLYTPNVYINTLNYNRYIKAGETKILPEATVQDFCARLCLPDSTVTWTSSNPSVATVSNGKVTGISPGKVDLTATMTDPFGTKLSSSFEMEVYGYAKSYITKLLKSFTPKILEAKGGKHKIKVGVKKFSKLPVIYQIEGKLVKNGKIVDRVKSGYCEEPRETFTRSGLWGSFTSGTWKFRTRIYHHDRDGGKTYYSKWSSWSKVKVK